jgi:hypothetical protein
MTGFGVTRCQRTGPSSLPLEVQPLTGDHDQVISLPTYAGRYNPGAYFDWKPLFWIS